LAALLQSIPDQIQKFVYRQTGGLRFVGIKITESFCPRSALGVSPSLPVVLELLSHLLLNFDP
jgi:hypothetical protein